MTVAIMQPYIFPYLGYYQLVGAADTFVFFDDVNYINKGWINRNNILQQDKPLKFTVPLEKASQNRLINEIEISDYQKWKQGFLKMIEINYKRAPHFTFVFNWLNEFLSRDFLLIGDLACESIRAVAKWLGLPSHFKNSGALNYKSNLSQKGEQKIINICKLLDAGKYINPENGSGLYNADTFKAQNIQLNFIQMQKISYPQFKKDEFVPSLSLIDVMMFNSKDQILEMLGKYDLR